MGQTVAPAIQCGNNDIMWMFFTILLLDGIYILGFYLEHFRD